MDNREVVVAASFANKNANFDISVYPVRAQGTTDGVQYGAEVVTVIANTDYELLRFNTYDHFPRLRGLLSWVNYIISFEIKAGSITADLIYKLQARNKDGTWTDMCAAVTCTDINTTYVAKTIKGYLDIKTNIIQIPFEMRLIFQSNEATPGIGTGRVKNDTIIHAVGSVGGIS